MIGWIVLVASCRHPKPVEIPEVADLDVILAAARARALPLSGVQAAFKIELDGETVQGTTVGALVLHPPDDLRIEIQSPFRTPLLLVATDGTSVGAWMAKGNKFLRGDNAVSALEALAAGAVRLEDVLDLITGIPPLDDVTILSREAIEGGVRAQCEGSAGTLTMDVDAKTALLRRIEARRDGEILLVATYDGTASLGADVLPAKVDVELPRVGLTIGLDFQSWQELGRVPDVFVLEPPAGSEQVDLLDELRKLTEPKSAPIP